MEKTLTGLNLQKSLVDTIEQDVKFSEVDSLGIVWHGHYVRYFEDGRESFGKTYNLTYLSFYKAGFVVPIVTMQCDYKRFLRYGDRVLIETTYTPCEAAKINFSYRLLNADTKEVVVTGSTTQVFLNKDALMLYSTNPDFFQEWKLSHNLI